MICTITFPGTKGQTERLVVPWILLPAFLIDWCHIHQPPVNWDFPVLPGLLENYWKWPGSFAGTRAVKWFCKGTSGSGGSLFLLMVFIITSFHSSMLSVSLPSVWSWGVASACGPTSDCVCNHLTPPQFSWCCTAFSPPPAAQSHAAGNPPPWAHLLQAGLLPVPATRGRSRHFQQPEVCTAASPFSSSGWKHQPALG